MGAIRVRFLGGALNGRVLWVEEDRASLEVRVAGNAGVMKILRYLRDGAIASFVGEVEAPASQL